MNGLGGILRKVSGNPPAVVFKKIKDRLSRSVDRYIEDGRDRLIGSFHRGSFPHFKNRRLKAEQLDISGLNHEVVEHLWQCYSRHHFDLLGSGWVDYGYHAKPLGLEDHRYQNVETPIAFDSKGEWLSTLLGRSNLDQSKKIWKMISPGYNPIDWHRDIKTGWRFSPKGRMEGSVWFSELARGQHPGVDLKVPWELSRLQHLPQLAIFALALPERRREILLEIRNQSLDFIAVNPPRIGVNWLCTMDVAIRAANICVACDIFHSLDCAELFDRPFERLISRSLYEHGLFIVNHLEYSPRCNSNHYLADIVGLLFVAVYLESTEQTDAWLTFAVQELIDEFSAQFYPDGSNFEGSSSYHRLSLEMIVAATALLLGLDDRRRLVLRHHHRKFWSDGPEFLPLVERKERPRDNRFFPDWYWQRLSRAAEYTHDLTKPSGEIAQIGDNDSGRFFRLSPNGRMLGTAEASALYRNLEGYDRIVSGFAGDREETPYWDENILDHGTVLAMSSALFARDVHLSEYQTKFPFEVSFIAALAGGRFSIRNSERIVYPLISAVYAVEALSYCERCIFRAPKKIAQPLYTDLSFIAYPDSGIYIFRSPELYCLISAGPNGQNGNGGHAHNDKLALELSISGEYMLVDPGTYLYTALPNRRNAFRSVKAHNTLVVENLEQNEFFGTDRLFTMADQSRCRVVERSERTIAIELTYRHVVQIRRVSIAEDFIEIVDRSNVPFRSNFNSFSEYSNGYGKLLRFPNRKLREENEPIYKLIH